MPAAASFSRWLADDAIVLRVGANPEPEHAVWGVDRKRAVVGSDARGVETTNLERRVSRIGLEEIKLLDGEVPDRFW